MFGNKKMYKKGLADAMSAYEAFGKKQEDALAEIRKEVREGKSQLEDALSGLGDELNGIYDYLDAKEKAALYHLNTPYDIKDMEESEQRLLVALLYQLAENEGERLNNYQRTYIHGIQRYLEITNPQIGLDDLSVVGEIDSGNTQKAILQTVLEFFYLQDGDEISEDQEDFLENFSVNKKQATAIENTVSRLYNAVGAKGLAEKYGNDEVIQQAKEQTLAAFDDFEHLMDSEYFHVRSHFVCNIWADKDYSNVSRSAYIDDECYKDNSKCRNDAERYLERYWRQIEKKMGAYTKRYGDDSIYKSYSEYLDSLLKEAKARLTKLRNPRTASIVDQISEYLTKTKVLDSLSSVNDRLAGKYQLPNVGNYTGEISYEINDPSEFADGFFGRMIASGFKKYGYSLDSAINSISEDSGEKLRDFVEELTDQTNDHIDRYILDPIQGLLPSLHDALYDQENT